MNNAFDVLADRGFVQQTTDREAIRTQLDKPTVAYVGIDPTADSLHVGHLLPLMAMMHLQRAGHKPILVLGGGTARVGDPSGKTEMRQLIEGDQISINSEALRKQLLRLFNASGTSVVDNSDWLLNLNYISFLRDIGRHFSVNRMLTAEGYKQRLERGLSFIEFNYQLLQAYDFLELFRRYKCTLQIGGDDQWSNILAGADLVRRLEQTTVHGLTFPLLTTATGEKMGKTAGGAVWLDSAKLSPFDYYQYWVNIHDADLVRLLGFFTFLPMDEVRSTASLQNAELNAAKSILAFEATSLVHGEEQAAGAHAAAQAAFGGRVLPAHILPSSKVPRQSSTPAEAIPTTSISSAELATLSVVDLLVRTGLVPSKNEARRLVAQGAVRLEPGDTVSDVAAKIEVGPGGTLLRVGKKKVQRIVVG